MSAAELAARARTVAAETMDTRLEALAEIVSELAELSAMTEPGAIAALKAIDELHTNRNGGGEELDSCYHCSWSWPCPTRLILERVTGS